jgi:hypothetical protein
LPTRASTRIPHTIDPTNKPGNSNDDDDDDDNNDVPLVVRDLSLELLDLLLVLPAKRKMAREG